MTYREFYRKYADVFARDYQIGFCGENEINDLTAFLNTYWKENHALVRSRALMDWQHYDEENKRYNFVIARHLKTGKIHAIVGFIPATHYSPSVVNNAIWGAIWKSWEDVALPGLGVAIVGYLCEMFAGAPLMGFGISDDAWKLYKHHGAITGHVKRYYILHPEKQTFKLCDIRENTQRCTRATSITACELTYCDNDYYSNLPDTSFAGCPPYKDRTYYLNRYIRHPIYTYHVICANNKMNGAQGLIIWRFCEYDGARCIRIVDYAGDIHAIAGALDAFNEILREYDAEFIDFIQYGLEKQAILDAGFVDVEGTGNILAHYFEPYILNGINTRFCCYPQGDSVPLLFFKGDADQDRPNIIPEVSK